MSDQNKRFAEYVKKGGVRCPYCGGNQLHCGDFDISHGAGYQNVECMECEREWTDEYSLTGVTVGADDEMWWEDSIQFPRLIAEIEAAGGFSPKVLDALEDSMDLERKFIFELIDRARNEWDKIKEKI